jgi:hypothetical protein
MHTEHGFQVILMQRRHSVPGDGNPSLRDNMNKKNGRAFALWGAWLQLGAVIGLLWTVVGMVRISQSEPASAGALANEISISLITTVIGMIPAFIGVILMAVALFGKKYRARWFFWFLIGYGVLWAVNYPEGTVFGCASIIYLIWKKDEFLARNSEQGGAGNAATLHA